jgi:DNA-directed RNA polymerase specialized sigma24 family protein
MLTKNIFLPLMAKNIFWIALQYIESSNMVDNETLQKLNAQDWEEIILELNWYVRMRFRGDSELKKGFEVEDLVSNAIFLVYTGDRKWDYQKDPDLIVFLKFSVIKSLISNYFNAKELSMTTKLSYAGLSDANEELSDPIGNIPNCNHGIDAEMEAKETYEIMISALANDDDAQLVFEELAQGAKPREIAESLSYKIEDVRNIIKRVERKISKVILNK